MVELCFGADCRTVAKGCVTCLLKVAQQLRVSQNGTVAPELRSAIRFGTFRRWIGTVIICRIWFVFRFSISINWTFPEIQKCIFKYSIYNFLLNRIMHVFRQSSGSGQIIKYLSWFLNPIKLLKSLSTTEPTLHGGSTKFNHRSYQL